MIRGIASRGITGTPDRVKLGLERLAAEYGAEEVIALTITYDFKARLRSYELLAGVCGLSPR